MKKNYYYVYKVNGVIRISTIRPQCAQVFARVSTTHELATVALVMNRFEIRKVK